MLIQSRTFEDEKPRYFHAHVLGGAAFCVLTPIYIDALEKYTGKTARELHPGGFSCASGGAFTAAAATLPDPNDRSKPLFLMKDFKQVFMNALPVCLAVPKNFIRDQITTSIVRRYSTAGRIFHNIAERPIHIPTQKLEQQLKNAFGEANLQDAAGTLFINTQKICPEPIEPFDFYHIEPGLLREDSTLAANNPGAPVPMWKCILATSALPGVFSAVQLEIAGQEYHLIDSGEMDKGLDTVLTIRRNLPKGYDMGFVLYGNVDHNMSIAPQDYEKMGLLDLSIRSVTRKFSSQQLNHRMLKTLRGELGQNNVFDIEFPSVNSPVERHFKLDKLDTSPAQLKALWEDGHAYIEYRSEWVRRIGDTLGENLEKIQRAGRDYVPAVVAQQAYNNPSVIPGYVLEQERVLTRWSFGNWRIGRVDNTKPAPANGSQTQPINNNGHEESAESLTAHTNNLVPQV